MVFPRPLPLVAEVHAGSFGWVSLGSDPRYADGFSMKHGRQSESAGNATASTCSFTLDNEAGTWSNLNPLSPYFGEIGLNTPFRLSITRVVDSFTGRTVASGWGTTSDGGHAWSTFGASSAGTDWSVSGGVARQSVDAVNESRLSYLPTTDFYDVDVRVTVDITGATSAMGSGDSLFPANIALRGTSTSSYIRFRLVITAAGLVYAQFTNPAGTIIGNTTTILTGWAGEALTVRAQVEGRTCRGRVWDATDPEPREWHLNVSHPDLTDLDTPSGWVGIRSSVGSGNTNPKPVVFEYTNLTVSLPRFVGEIPDWQQQHLEHPHDHRLRIDAAGILRRLGRRKAPELSPMRRAIMAGTAPSAYWPMEDESSATSLASALQDGQPLVFGGGDYDTVNLAASEAFAGSDKIPEFGGPLGSYLTGVVPAAVDDNQLLATALISVPVAGVTQTVQVLNVRVRGGYRPLGEAMVEVNTAGECRIRVRDWLGVDLLLSSFSTGFTLNGRPSLLGMRLTQNGVNVDWQVFRYTAGTTTSPALLSGTIASQSFGVARDVAVGLGGDLNDTAIGHVAVWHTDADIALSVDILTAVTGWNAEPAGERAERLVAEEGYSFTYYGDLADTTPMGPQPAKGLQNLLEECAAADTGILGEPRGDLGVAYRTRTSLYHQGSPITLDYSAGELSPPFDTSYDDQLIRNDVTVNRVGGSSYNAVLETGSRSVNEPPSGVGVYDDTKTINVAEDYQCEDQAWWLVALGTIDEPRCPTLKLRLERSVLDGRLDELAALSPGTRVRVQNPPARVSSTDLDLLVVGTQEQVDQVSWQITCVCVPYTLYDVPVADGTRKVDTDDSYLASPLTSSATSLSVASTWLWSTTATAGHIMVAGEEMNVTAVSGASSPQTLTVTRSTNGVVKTHPAGVDVVLSPRTRFGY